MELFYVQSEAIKGNYAVLDEFERRHIVQTLRKKSGDLIHLTDGQGHHYIGNIEKTTPQLFVHISKTQKVPSVQPPIALACGFIKQNRLDFILEKGTELGITHFIFFKSRFTNYQSHNSQRFQKIIRQALKQSLQYCQPELTFLETFNEFLEFSPRFKHKIVAIDQTFPSLKETIEHRMTTGSWLITIGPEGGFSEQEIGQLLANHFAGVSLGVNRLRTETAAIAALSFIKQFIHQ